MCSCRPFVPVAGLHIVSCIIEFTTRRLTEDDLIEVIQARA